MKMDLIKCTKPNGDPLYLALHQITAVTVEHERTRIIMVDSIWSVKESMDEVVKMIQGPTMDELFDRIIGGGECGEPEPPVTF